MNIFLAILTLRDNIIFAYPDFFFFIQTFIRNDKKKRIDMHQRKNDILNGNTKKIMNPHQKLSKVRWRGIN